MGLEPISVELTDFNKLELLRDEEERLAEELAAVERDMREALLVKARSEYLASLSPYYSGRVNPAAPAPDQAGMEQQRVLVSSTLDVVRVQREQLEAALGSQAGGGASPRAPRGKPAAGGSRSSSFQSFEDFRQNRG